jgi:hypothetical protein
VEVGSLRVDLFHLEDRRCQKLPRRSWHIDALSLFTKPELTPSVTEFEDPRICQHECQVSK